MKPQDFAKEFEIAAKELWAFSVESLAIWHCPCED